MSRNYAALIKEALPHAVAGLVVSCVAIGLVLSAWVFIRAPNFTTFVASWSLGLYFAFFAALAGAALTAVYGAPVYALLLYCGRASLVGAALAGIVPGVVAWVAGGDLWQVYVMFGAAVGACTHLLYQRHGPNNSFKPKPLRGSA